MILNNNSLILNYEETKDLCESYMNNFDSEDIIKNAANIADIKAIRPVYFESIYSACDAENIQHIKQIKLDRAVCSKKLEKRINNVFKTIQKINGWAASEKEFFYDLYKDRITSRLIKAIIGTVCAFIIYLTQRFINPSYRLLLFDICALYVFLQLGCALLYYRGLRKIEGRF